MSKYTLKRSVFKLIRYSRRRNTKLKINQSNRFFLFSQPRRRKKPLPIFLNKKTFLRKRLSDIQITDSSHLQPFISSFPSIKKTDNFLVAHPNVRFYPRRAIKTKQLTKKDADFFINLERLVNKKSSGFCTLLAKTMMNFSLTGNYSYAQEAIMNPSKVMGNRNRFRMHDFFQQFNQDHFFMKIYFKYKATSLFSRFVNNISGGSSTVLDANFKTHTGYLDTLFKDKENMLVSKKIIKESILNAPEGSPMYIERLGHAFFVFKNLDGTFIIFNGADHDIFAVQNSMGGYSNKFGTKNQNVFEKSSVFIMNHSEMSQAIDKLLKRSKNANNSKLLVLGLRPEGAQAFSEYPVERIQTTASAQTSLIQDMRLSVSLDENISIKRKFYGLWKSPFPQLSEYNKEHYIKSPFNQNSSFKNLFNVADKRDLKLFAEFNACSKNVPVAQAFIAPMTLFYRSWNCEEASYIFAEEEKLSFALTGKDSWENFSMLLGESRFRTYTHDLHIIDSESQVNEEFITRISMAYALQYGAAQKQMEDARYNAMLKNLELLDLNAKFGFSIKNSQQIREKITNKLKANKSRFNYQGKIQHKNNIIAHQDKFKKSIKKNKYTRDDIIDEISYSEAGSTFLLLLDDEVYFIARSSIDFPIIVHGNKITEYDDLFMNKDISEYLYSQKTIKKLSDNILNAKKILFLQGKKQFTKSKSTFEIGSLESRPLHLIKLDGNLPQKTWFMHYFDPSNLQDKAAYQMKKFWREDHGNSENFYINFLLTFFGSKVYFSKDGVLIHPKTPSKVWNLVWNKENLMKSFQENMKKIKTKIQFNSYKIFDKQYVSTVSTASSSDKYVSKLNFALSLQDLKLGETIFITLNKTKSFFVYRSSKDLNFILFDKAGYFKNVLPESKQMDSIHFNGIYVNENAIELLKAILNDPLNQVFEQTALWG